MSSPPQLIDWSFLETAKGYLMIMYPQFSRDQIEIAVAKEATSSASIRFRYHVSVWVHTKEPDINGRNLKLLELGPECQSVEEAFRSYVDARLIPEVSAKTREHAAKTRMTRWRVAGLNPQQGFQAIWPGEDSSRPSEEATASSSRSSGTAPAPPPTYAEARSNPRVELG